MLQKFEIHGVHTKVDDKLQTYINKKIGRLDRYIARHCRDSVHGEVHLKETNVKDKNRYICEVTFHMPQQNIVVKERALNMYAAIDIAEVKLKQQLQKYKELHGSGKMHRRIIARFSRVKSL